MPTGKDQVVSALLAAATELFAERGPGAVSVRDVASRAKVNHGLVHRHFGSKDGLVRAVLDGLVDDLRQRHAAVVFEGGVRGAVFDEMADNQLYWRVLARALLDGNTEWLQDGQFPLIGAGVAQLKAAMERGDVAPGDAQAMVASYVAAALGWLVFEPFIAAATGMEGSAESRRKRMLDLWELIERASLAPTASASQQDEH